MGSRDGQEKAASEGCAKGPQSAKILFMSVCWFNDVSEKTNRDGKKDAGEFAPAELSNLMGAA